MRTLIQDARYAVRTLVKNPAFGAVAILALALGIGATTAIFSVVNAALLRPLPYPSPERLTVLHKIYPNGAGNAVTAFMFSYWRDHNHSFEHVAACTSLGAGFTLTGTTMPERVPGIAVTGDFFRVLGVSPEPGRGFLTEEERVGAKVAILSDSLWRRRFGADPGVLGRAIGLGG
ncbi:MAG: ABC transporter permease, partial [Bryobacteraceae bacterium]